MEPCITDPADAADPRELFTTLRRFLYKKRTEIKPLVVVSVLAGFKDGAAFIGQADLYGTFFEADYAATGMGAHMVMPLIRDQWRADMPLAEAQRLIERCMMVLHLNHTAAGAKYMLGTADAAGTNVLGPFELNTEGKWIRPSPH